MSSILREIDGGWIDSRIPDIAKRLSQRDHRLSIAARCGEGGIVEAYELHWRGPDGRDNFVCFWTPDEVGQIETDVMLADQEASGHVPVIDRVEKAAAEKDKRDSANIQGWHQEIIEHWARLERDTETRHFFGQAGRGEGKRGREE